MTLRGQSLPADSPRTGRFQATFDARGELGLWPAMAKRFHWRGQLPEPYEIADQAFEVFVPEAVPDAPRSLLVWVSASDDGSPPANWLPILKARQIAWVGANAGGNQRPPAHRFALAIDAAQNATKRYAIDPSRVYIAGVSGGGRVASMVAPMYPDLFRGAIYIVGCSFWKDLDVPSDPESFWRRQFREPPAEWLDLARGRSRIVFLTGETDMNREETQTVWRDGYKAEGFKHTAYIEVPGMGHELPDAEWFDKALGAMLGTADQGASR